LDADPDSAPTYHFNGSLMGVSYRAILWNKSKKRYDLWMSLFIILVLVVFVLAQMTLHPSITIETLIIRATAFTAITLLHVILIIGPLCRLDSRFLPLLYNRRHLGVTMFLFALVHGLFCIIQFHALGDTNPIASVFLSNQNYQEISEFPFQILGFLALVILLLMAATSHDFWLKNLTPRMWKGLHMAVYIAYALVVGHVALGTLQYESKPLYWVMLLGGFVAIAGLQIFTGLRELKRLRSASEKAKDKFVRVCNFDDIEDSRAKIVTIGSENIAVFRYDDQISAVSNICRHQLGPLGEGKIVDGCITCPWHGYQYHPHNGQSPPPFNEKLKTYEVNIRGRDVWVNPKPKSPGTFIQPAKLEGSAS
jgi:nitrite reductase/ring-hydroxylating ferredoxin subunit/DMSO/TMAO reductase YedYZ heme-binding membrane subunit